MSVELKGMFRVLCDDVAEESLICAKKLLKSWKFPQVFRQGEIYNQEMKIQLCLLKIIFVCR
jgi:hypothetical protein